jgi:hypothetical protein
VLKLTLSACAQLTWLLDDVGIPQDWRHLEGHSVNTYLFINAEGVERYFKMRWLPTLGASPWGPCVNFSCAWSWAADAAVSWVIVVDRVYLAICMCILCRASCGSISVA